MKDFIICLAVLLLIIFVPAAFAQQHDSRYISSRYDPNSADSINNPYSQTNQYSADSINNPYSPTNQNSPGKVNYLSPQQELDWHAGHLIEPDQSAAKAAKKAKETAAEAQARKFFGDGRPKKQIPVFFYLLVVSSLAVGATVLIIIASLKK